MRQAGNVGNIREKSAGFWWESPKERNTQKTEAQIGGWDQKGS
jgi:hypothetical protein